MIRSRLFTVATAIALTASLHATTGAAQSATKPDVTGKWQFSVTTGAGTGTPTLTLTQKGDSITGHYSSQVLGETEVAGAIKGQSITLRLNVEMQGTPIAVTYNGTVDSADTMKGTVDLGGQANGTFTGKRQ
jgi:hypothetical protein